MAMADTGYVPTIREQLLDRRSRLEDVLGRNDSEQLNHLLHEVDQALDRIDVGKFGICETCHDTIETDRLLTDPLIRVCLGCLTPSQQRALEYDLELAAQVQNGLLPPPGFVVPGWEICYHFRPAGVVSGDYFDLMADGKGGMAFVIADVSGKGVAAAMLSANLRAMFRALVPLNLSTDKLLANASRLFCESTLANHYATMIFGKTTASGELELVNAGHLPALLVQPSGITVFESNTLPVGMFCDQEFTASRARLSPGDTLVLYTDGISETLNEANEEYGIQKLRGLLEEHRLNCPNQIIEACRRHVEQFRGTRERFDDETLLAIQYASGAGEPSRNVANA